MTQGKLGSYDDAVESEVSTVLQVPLLWRQNGLVTVEPGTSARHRAPNGASNRAPNRAPTGRRSNGRGRHRAPDAAPTAPPAPPAPAAPVETAPPRAARELAVTRARVVPDPARTRREEYAHTLRIGLISAAMVLLLFVVALFGLAVWLP